MEVCVEKEVKCMALIDVVKYDGSPDVFAWKYPNSELGTWTQLIVNESQEAVLFKGGNALDAFGSGRHTLDTANIPLLNHIVNLPFGGRSPFSAEVWFVNKVSSLDIKWGTPTPIQIQDPRYGVFIPVRSFGQFGIKIEDSKKFLIKLVGTLPILDRDSLLKFFRGLYITKVKDTISTYVVKKQISLLEINAYLDELSVYMQERIEPTLNEYGIKLLNFYVNDINIPEDDSAVITLKDALAKRAEMNIIGYNYQQERSFDTLEGAATNPGTSAGVMGAGLGLGMGFGIGGAMGPAMGGIASNLNTAAPSAGFCPNCHAPLVPGKRFCADCGCDTTAPRPAAQPASSAPAQQEPRFKCSQCGAMLTKGVKFCPECGSKYNPCPKCGADMPDGAKSCSECGYQAPSPCPKCGSPIVGENVKFCPECGSELIQKCPKCHSIVYGTPKFCPLCGQQL